MTNKRKATLDLETSNKRIDELMNFQDPLHKWMPVVNHLKPKLEDAINKGVFLNKTPEDSRTKRAKHPTGFAQELSCPKTEMWRTQTMRCLQLALVPLLSSPKDANFCDIIERQAFESHVGCYTHDIAPFCGLPISDWKTIGI